MNLFEKLQKVRCDLQNKNLKKSGRNRFSGYDYYELGDFLPTINAMCLQEKLCTAISFTAEEAVLSIINAENPDEELVFKSPMATVTLKGCHDIQNLGAVETYQRRYLYMSAFEIVEHDELDAVTGKEKGGNTKENTPSEPTNDEATPSTTGTTADGRSSRSKSRTEKAEEAPAAETTGRRSRTPRVEAEQVATEQKPIDKANAVDVTPTLESTGNTPRGRRGSRS